MDEAKDSVNSSASVSASFDKPPGLVRAAQAGDWDEAQNAKSDPIEELENASWRHDEDANNELLATDFADEEEEVEDKPPLPPESDDNNEEAEEQDQVEDPDEPADEVPDDDAVEGEQQELSPRANERIRQLVQEKKKAEEEASAFREEMRQLLAVQRRQAELAEKLETERQSKQRAIEAQDAKQRQIQELKALGFDETKIADWLAYESLQTARANETKIKEIEASYAKKAQEAGIRAYENALRSELDKSLTDPKSQKPYLSTEERESLYKAAYALARDEQIKDPSEAVKRVVAPILKFVKPSPKVTKRPQPSDATHKVISTQGKGVGKSSGQRASGKKPLANDVLEFLGERRSRRF